MQNIKIELAKTLLENENVEQAVLIAYKIICDYLSQSESLEQ